MLYPGLGSYWSPRFRLPLLAYGQGYKSPTHSQGYQSPTYSQGYQSPRGNRFYLQARSVGLPVHRLQRCDVPHKVVRRRGTDLEEGDGTNVVALRAEVEPASLELCIYGL